MSLPLTSHRRINRWLQIMWAAFPHARLGKSNGSHKLLLWMYQAFCLLSVMRRTTCGFRFYFWAPRASKRCSSAWGMIERPQTGLNKQFMSWHIYMSSHTRPVASLGKHFHYWLGIYPHLCLNNLSTLLCCFTSQGVHKQTSTGIQMLWVNTIYWSKQRTKKLNY